MYNAELFLLILFCFSFCDFSNCQACGSILTNSGGTIESEGFPDSYPSFHTCVWTIQAGTYDVVFLVFRDFNVEPDESCKFDFLEISTKVQSQKFCGDKLSDVGNNGRLKLRGPVELTLETDDSVNFRGFSLQYQVTPGEAPPTTPPPTTIPTTTPLPVLTCDDDPCLNGGECTMIDDSEFYCFCEEGFDGERCENGKDECLSNPCKNGGTCVDGRNSWSCECVDGFYGESCAIDSDECLADPCKNGATCEDGVNSFYCACTKGWTGWDCDTDIDECSPDPCQNNGFCEDHLGYYSCFCHPKYTGQNCTVELAEEPTISPEDVLSSPPENSEATTTTTTPQLTESPATTKRPLLSNKEEKPTTELSSLSTPTSHPEGGEGRNSENDEVPSTQSSTQSSGSTTSAVNALTTLLYHTTYSNQNETLKSQNDASQFPVLTLVSSVAGFMVTAIISLLTLYCCKFGPKNKKIEPMNGRTTAAPY